VLNGRRERRPQMCLERLVREKRRKVFLKIKLLIKGFQPLFSGSLLPSHGLPPFGANITNIAMSESLCGTSMFGTDRWGVGVNPMTAGNYHCISIFNKTLLNGDGNLLLT
jgi:hypothetical protein